MRHAYVAYRGFNMGTATDQDLTPLFNQCSDADLQPIVDCIVAVATNGLDISPGYQARPQAPSTYVAEIVYEIKTFGGNSIANLFRSDGVPYREIVTDVARHLKIQVPDDGNVKIEALESSIYLKLLKDILEGMTPEERQKLNEEINAAGRAAGDKASAIPLSVLLAQGSVQLTGFMAYKLAAIVANQVARFLLGRGLSMGANAALMRVLGAATGPIGWAISGVWTVASLASPAFRVTLPCVCHVAALRQKKLSSSSRLRR